MYTGSNIDTPIVLDGIPAVQTTVEEQLTGFTLTNNIFGAYVKQYIKMRRNHPTLGLILDTNKDNSRYVSY